MNSCYRKKLHEGKYGLIHILQTVKMAAVANIVVLLKMA
jgi:hypothetical protein